MIAKDKEYAAHLGSMELAGDAAERQMAFYLRRRFADDPAAHVLNDLRVQRNAEVAQMDHLVLHRHGIIIIESKSVTGEMHINEQLEFERVSRDRRVGLPSPIQQAIRQGELLRRLLVDHNRSLRNRKLMGLVQGGFRHCPIDILVAISDQGVIRRPSRLVPELHKADHIPDRVQTIMTRHQKAFRLTGRVDGHWGRYSFEEDELKRVVDFLNHQAVASSSSSTAQPQSSTASPKKHRSDSKNTPACHKCHGIDLEIRFGHTYYFKCLTCEANTPIKNTCSSCGASTKTRKQGLEFSSVCESCGHAELFFTNRARLTN